MGEVGHTTLPVAVVTLCCMAGLAPPLLLCAKPLPRGIRVTGPGGWLLIRAARDGVISFIG